jgi:hypothetical protein
LSSSRAIQLLCALRSVRAVGRLASRQRAR